MFSDLLRAGQSGDIRADDLCADAQLVLRLRLRTFAPPAGGAVQDLLALRCNSTGKRIMKMKAAAFAAGLLMFAIAPAARAQTDAQPYYKGQTIRMVSGAGAASGYTIWAHFLAQFLPRHIPGNPNVVVE